MGQHSTATLQWSWVYIQYAVKASKNVTRSCSSSYVMMHKLVGSGGPYYQGVARNVQRSPIHVLVQFSQSCCGLFCIFLAIACIFLFEPVNIISPIGWLIFCAGCSKATAVAAMPIKE